MKRISGFGLRRAFMQAGAKSLAMNLWSVPARKSKELMIELCEKISEDKMNRSQALLRHCFSKYVRRLSTSNRDSQHVFGQCLIDTGGITSYTPSQERNASETAPVERFEKINELS